MKILISADMEGTAGVSSWVHVTPPEGAGGEPANQVEYERARLRMTCEVDAAIEGALAGGAGRSSSTTATTASATSSAKSCTPPAATSPATTSRWG